MPYSRSPARTSFDQRIHELEKTAFAIHRRKRERPQVRGLVFRACIVEGCSALEEYFDSVLSSWVYLIGKNDVTLSRIPDNFLNFDLLIKTKSFARSIFQEKGEKDLLTIADRTLKTMVEHRERDRLPTYIDGIYMLSEKKFPSPKNIEVIMFRFGIDGFFDKIGASSRRNFRELLQAFIGIRGAVVHASPPNLTFSDIERDLKMLRSLVNFADRIIYTHVIAKTGQACWDRKTSPP